MEFYHAFHMCSVPITKPFKRILKLKIEAVLLANFLTSFFQEAENSVAPAYGSRALQQGFFKKFKVIISFSIDSWFFSCLEHWQIRVFIFIRKSKSNSQLNVLKLRFSAKSWSLLTRSPTYSVSLPNGSGSGRPKNLRTGTLATCIRTHLGISVCYC